MATDNRTLPKKEADSFRSLVTFYETKQFKKGIKTADLVLKKFPNHGETLAMKGLILNSLEKKEEAYDFVKKGLKNDVRSHVCWHVFGLLHRSDRNYKEAIKCYLNALRIDNDNQQILRDLSWLQIQMRDAYGFVETRRKILVLKPSVRQNWVTYGIANYVAGEFSTANEVITKYIETTAEKEIGYEFSEILLFQIKCTESSGQYEEALIQLDKNEYLIVDKLSIRVKKAELYLLLQNFTKATNLWMNLVRDQTENYRFHTGLQIAILQLDVNSVKQMLTLTALQLPCTELVLNASEYHKLLDFYQNELSKLSKSRAIKKIILSLLLETDLSQFEIKLDEYIKKGLRDGLPALYNDICALIRIPHPHRPHQRIFVRDPYDYKHHPVTAIAMRLVDDYIAALRANGTLSANPSELDEVEAPTVLLWALFLKSHLLEMTGSLCEALVVIDEAIEHTPTALDMRSKKAKILKKSGDFVAAAHVMEECRKLDLQDRYLNNKTTKYLLRANQIEQAMATIELFTKHDGDPQQTLYDLQCIWYELEMGESYGRKRMYGPALKKFYAIEKHFLDFLEDQFDFHPFSMRKTTLRAYIDMLTMEDNLFSHKFFQRATHGVLSLYIDMLDTPIEEAKDDEEVDLSKLSAADRKREKNKLRKAKNKAAASAATKDAEDKVSASQSQAGGEDKKGTATPKDDDPVGEKILAKDPLEEMSRWVEEATRSLHLTKSASSLNPKSLALISEVYIRRNKLLLAIRVLNYGLYYYPFHPDLVYQLVRLQSNIQKATSSSEPNPISAVTLEVLQEQLQTLLNNKDIVSFVNNFIEMSRSSSLLHRISALQCSVILHPNDEQHSTRVAETLFGDAEVENIWNGRAVTVEDVTYTHNVLSKRLKLAEVAERFKTKAISVFPLMNVFGGGQELQNGPVVTAETGETEQRSDP